MAVAMDRITLDPPVSPAPMAGITDPRIAHRNVLAAPALVVGEGRIA